MLSQQALPAHPHSSNSVTPSPRGHGTQIVDDKLVATQCGLVTRTDKLISVKPPKER
jgi:exosome complex RNA-binding protein Rrp4